MLVVWFPVVYGYNLVLGANIEARVVFLCSWMFVVIAISVYSYMILYLRCRFATLSTKVCVTTCVILLICAIPANILWVSAIRPIHADGEYRFSKTGLHIFYSELFSGELNTYYTLARECYDTAKYSGGTMIVNGSQTTSITNQMMGGGMQGGNQPGGSMMR